jgi:hypothetical protein
MKNFKYLFLVLAIVSVAMGVWMLGNSFFPPCKEAYGTMCSFNVGSQATIDEPAYVLINSDKSFSVELKNTNGEAVTFNAVNNDFYYVVNMTIDQSTSLFMSEAAGGKDTPTIAVIKRVNNDAYPHLSIQRTWYRPLEQLSKWILFPLFMLYLVLSVLGFAIFLRYSKKN